MKPHPLRSPGRASPDDAPRELDLALEPSSPAFAQTAAPNLPQELWYDIFAQLDVDSLAAARLVSQEWSEAVDDPRLPMRRRRVLAACHQAFRRRPKTGAALVRRCFASHLRAAGEPQFLRDCALLFANVRWLERRDQAFARHLFAGASQLLFCHVPSFRRVVSRSAQCREVFGGKPGTPMRAGAYVALGQDASLRRRIGDAVTVAQLALDHALDPREFGRACRFVQKVRGGARKELCLAKQLHELCVVRWLYDGPPYQHPLQDPRAERMRQLLEHDPDWRAGCARFAATSTLRLFPTVSADVSEQTKATLAVLASRLTPLDTAPWSATNAQRTATADVVPALLARALHTL